MIHAHACKSVLFPCKLFKFRDSLRCNYFFHIGSDVISYVLEKKESGNKEWETLTSLPASVLECELENMTAEKDYYVRIRAENKHDVSAPAELAKPIRVRGIEKSKWDGLFNAIHT